MLIAPGFCFHKQCLLSKVGPSGNGSTVTKYGGCTVTALCIIISVYALVRMLKSFCSILHVVLPITQCCLTDAIWGCAQHLLVFDAPQMTERPDCVPGSNITLLLRALDVRLVCMVSHAPYIVTELLDVLQVGAGCSCRC